MPLPRHIRTGVLIRRSIASDLCSRGGVEDTRLDAKVKDRPSRGQGHRRKRSSKKKVFKNFFRRSLLVETQKKRSLQIFRKVSGVFQRNFYGSKIVLSSSRGQDSFRGLEALRPRTSKCVLEDSTSGM